MDGREEITIRGLAPELVSLLAVQGFAVWVLGAFVPVAERP